MQLWSEPGLNLPGKQAPKIRIPASNWKEKYQKIRPAYERFTLKLEEHVLRILEADAMARHGIAQVTTRTKKVENFERKATEKQYADPLREMKDLSGLRIITYDQDYREHVSTLILHAFDVDTDHSIDKSGGLGPDKFGYRSLQYIVGLTSRMVQEPQWAGYRDFKAEIQIRTLPEHAWAEYSRQYYYKPVIEIPTHLTRRFNRLSAVLELVDDEFLKIRRELEALLRQASQTASLDVSRPIDAENLLLYFLASDRLQKWARRGASLGLAPFHDASWLENPQGRANYIQEKLNGRRGTPPLHLVQVLAACQVKTLNDLGRVLQSADSWGMSFLQELKDMSAKGGFTPYAEPIDVITLLTLYGCRKKMLSGWGQERLTVMMGCYRPPIREALLVLMKRPDDSQADMDGSKAGGRRGGQPAPSR